MKQKFYLVGLLLFATFAAHSQLNLGGIHANFGVDADTRSGYSKYGPVRGNIPADDWFGFANGKGVIDTSNFSQQLSALQSNRNISFMRNMSAPGFSVNNGKLWLDAIFLRDYSSANGSDSSIFGNSAKNGADPRSWDGKAGSVPAKTDIVDAYAHLRRNGNSIMDSLWFFAGVSTVSTNGDRYFDIELFKNPVSYNSATGNFSSSGLSGGHTEWIFDPFGNIIQTGDLIIAFSYNSGNAPVIEVRIWVSRITQALVRPTLFKFSGTMDGGGLAGYATIVSKTGTTAFGAGIGNSSNNSASDTTYASPWGTLSKSGSWSRNYESLQMVEIGLNFTRMGIDPSSYSGLSYLSCERIFHSIFFKSRSSSSFSANLQDFAGPIAFKASALAGVTGVQGDTLTCEKKTGTLNVINPGGSGIYHWLTVDGNIIGSNPDSSVITVDKSGTYVLASALIAGCPTVRTDIVQVPVDNIPPVANADLAMTATGELQLIGGDPVLSNFATPFGPSNGLTYSWTGPNGFTSNEQSPILGGDGMWGAYKLTVTELRNGCKSTSWMDVSFKARKEQLLEEILPVQEATVNLVPNSSSNRLSIIATQPAEVNAKVTVLNSAGQAINNYNVRFNKGYTNLQLPLQASGSARIISVYVGNKLVMTRKIMF